LTSTKKLWEILDAKLIILKFRFIKLICKLKIHSVRIILSSACVKIGKWKLQDWSLAIESFRRTMSFSRKKIGDLLSI